MRHDQHTGGSTPRREEGVDGDPSSVDMERDGEPREHLGGSESEREILRMGMDRQRSGLGEEVDEEDGALNDTKDGTDGSQDGLDVGPEESFPGQDGTTGTRRER